MPENRRPQTKPATRAPRAQVAFLAAACGALKAGDALPDSLLLLNWGRNETPKGLFIVNERTVACLTANQRAMRRERVKGDFEHASVDEDPAKHPLKFGSEGEPQAKAGTGLLVASVVWTQAGRDAVPEHYGDISAAPIFDQETREVIGLHSYAHCRHGAADGATIENSLARLNAGLSALSNSLISSPTKPATLTMNPEVTLLCSLLTALGITCPENPTAEQLTAAVDEAKGKLPAPGAPADSPAMETLRTELATLKASIATLTTNLSKAEDLKKFVTLREAALGEGKIVTLSAEDLQLLGEARAKSHLDALPKDQVPVDQRTPGIVKLNANPLNGGGVHPEELQAYKDLGLEHPSLKKS